MARRQLPFSRRVGVGWLLAVLGSAVVSCTAPISVDTRAHEEARLSDYAAFRLTVGAGQGAEASRDEIPLAHLEREARALLRERGYRADEGGPDRVSIRLSAAPDRVVRRTWSADPGYNGYVEREREEGVLTLVARDDARGIEVWRGESRIRLPEPGLVVGPSREAAWMDALVGLIARVPARQSD